MLHSQGILCLWEKIRISPSVDAATEPAVSVPSRDPGLLGSVAEVFWSRSLPRVVVEHRLGSVAWQEDAEPGFAAAEVSSCSLAGLELLAQEHFGVLAKCWGLVHGFDTFLSYLGLSMLSGSAL